MLQIIFTDPFLHVIDLREGKVRNSIQTDEGVDDGDTWKELTSVDNPNICAVKVIVV
jgi:hypothetical protein